jgi:hypothetical protein
MHAANGNFGRVFDFIAISLSSSACIFQVGLQTETIVTEVVTEIHAGIGVLKFNLGC